MLTPALLTRISRPADFVVDRGADPLDRVRVHQIAGLDMRGAALGADAVGDRLQRLATLHPPTPRQSIDNPTASTLGRRDLLSTVRASSAKGQIRPPAV